MFIYHIFKITIMAVIPIEQVYSYLSMLFGILSPVKFALSLKNLPAIDRRVPSLFRDRPTGRFLPKSTGYGSLIAVGVGSITFLMEFAGYHFWSGIISIALSIAVGGWVDVFVSIGAFLFSSPN